MLLVSLGLHGFLLFVPISSTQNPILAKKEDAVKITQLPTNAGKPSPKSAAKQPPKQQQTRRRTTVPDRSRSIVTPRPQIAKTHQSSSRADQNGARTGVGDQATSSPFADFPHYPNAQPNGPDCQGLKSCRQTSDELDSVVAHFEKQLPAKKFTASLVTNEVDKKVYQVSKGNMTQYLNLFAVAEGVVYVLSPQPINLADLKTAIEVPPELYVALGELGGETTNDTAFDDPGNFYDKLSSRDERGSVLLPEPRPGIDGSPQLVSDQTPSQVRSDLQPKLESNAFQVSEAKPYGGGALYKLQKGNFTGYLSLVPSKDRRGTIVVVWTRSPY